MTLDLLEALEAMARPTVGPSRRCQPDTAVAAAKANAPRSPGQRQRCLLALVDAGERGLNSWELSVAAGIPRMHSAHTRAAELAVLDLVVLTDIRRPTDTGADALVWVALPAGVAAARELRGE